MSPSAGRLSRLLAEVRRRHVVRVLIAYIVASWVVAQVAADVAFPALGLGDGAIRNLVITIIAGLPVVVVLSWLFDLTRFGVQRTAPLIAEVHSTEGTQSRVGTVAAPEATPNSVAVLPFMNLGGDQEDEYFCDGLTEELLDALARVPELRVAARTSSFAFKGKDDDVREIGRRLNVSRLVEGSVRRSGNRLRITAQLIKVSDGFHLWSQSFDRVVEDVFETQEEISREIVQAMDVTIPEAEATNPLVGRRTDNLAAYQLFLKGRFFWNQRGMGLQKGIEYFQKALIEEPSYAPALAGLGDCFALLGYYGFMPPKMAFPKAKVAAQRALELDPTLAEARTTLAFVQHFFDWDPEASERSFKKAIQLNPSYAPAHYWYAVLLSSQGRHQEALDRDFKAMEVDPVSPFLSAHHGYTLMEAGQFPAAVRQLEESMLLAPDSLSGAWLLSWAYTANGQWDRGVDVGQKAVELAGGRALLMPPVAYALASGGRVDEARALLRTMKERSVEEFVWPSHVAIVHLALGEMDEAFELLEKAIEVKDHWITAIRVEPAFGPARGDPRFEALARQIHA